MPVHTPTHTLTTTSNSTSSKGKTLHLSPLSDSLIPCPFLHIVLLHPQSLLTSQKAEPARSSRWAMTVESDSHEHALSPRPAKAEFSPTAIYLVRLVEQLVEAILLDWNRYRQRATGSRERESQPDTKKQTSICAKTERQQAARPSSSCAGSTLTATPVE